MTTVAPPPPADYNDTSPEHEAGDSSPEELRSPSRTYHVLEERNLAELVLELLGDESDVELDKLRRALEEFEVYEPVTVTEARNSEGALRNAAKQIVGRSGEVTLIPVSGRSWHPETVTIAVERVVTVHGR
jgi:hypothetical protein